MLLTQKTELLTDRLFIGDSVLRVGDDNFLLVFNDEPRLQEEAQFEKESCYCYCDSSDGRRVSFRKL